MKKLIFSSLILFLVIIADQLTKSFILTTNATFTCNPGFAFGLFQGLLNILIILLVLLTVIYIFTRETNRIVWLSLAWIIGGGTSNLLDRIIQGCVVDFINFGFWPAFNLADVAISVGVGLLVLSLIKSNRGNRG